MSQDSGPRSPQKPFNDPRADVILRSSDNVDFRTFKAILFSSSSIFDDMFSIPQPSTAPVEDVPVVEMEESARILELLLRFCHPGENPEMETFEDARDVLVVAMKYEMGFVAKAAQIRLLELGHDEPVRVYALACIHMVHDLAHDAARLALQVPEDDLLPTDHVTLHPEYSSVSLKAFVQLVSFHRRCSASLDLLVDGNFNGLVRPGVASCYNCGNPPFWWQEFKKTAKQKLKSRPCSETIDSWAYFPLYTCTSCKPQPTDMMKYIVKLREFIKDRVNQVPLDIDF
ncbi:hypothetical protein JAAARDRAFT_56369 [Jaapia argillacea MUCL 33604]|uniref:BTB domain-containing protein n=1 Tax=Jaapia argillacea MUCL 33604 TaxID=933084 RepID=A0A067Q2W3_9AGAM|nr:hypothetical protein JAAARDRAFT_56369 [Jaapia argillacea MUCL 33604]